MVLEPSSNVPCGTFSIVWRGHNEDVKSLIGEFITPRLPRAEPGGVERGHMPPLNLQNFSLVPVDFSRISWLPTLNHSPRDIYIRLSKLFQDEENQSSVFHAFIILDLQASDIFRLKGPDS
jgi:hypothetical protein